LKLPFYGYVHRQIFAEKLIKMKKLAFRWIILAFSVFAASILCQSLNLGFEVDVLNAQREVEFSKVLTLMIGVAVLALLNATLGRILKLITLPLSCLTLGLFSLVVNAAVLYFASTLKLGFDIKGTGIQSFFAAFVASVLISFINGVLGVLLPDGKDD